ncbi:hypothetical protein R3P38DRAFT_3193490 [Favolaschia claudopus]|uniref:Uncharacterized protein n=1 Tax=Favolaschia claudopus TaxID=2862362 RepID=A0AAW0BIR7_9AGAR
MSPSAGVRFASLATTPFERAAVLLTFHVVIAIRTTLTNYYALNCDPYDVASSIADVARLCLNITKPEGDDVPWFPASPSNPYTQPLNALPNVLRQLERVESPTESSSWTPRHLIDLAQDQLFPLLALVVDFGDITTDDGEDQFHANFRLGPAGLSPFIDLLHRLYLLVINWTPRLPHVEVVGFVSIINSFVAPIYNAVLHFRDTTPRYRYDPPGFAALRETTQKLHHRFGEADPEDELAVLGCHVMHDNVEAFVTALEADFVSATSADAMKPSALLVGPYGIDGFLDKIINPLLDTMPAHHPSYRPLMSLLGHFSGELSRKMTNFNKASGKRKFGAAPEDSDQAGGRYKTRSKSSHYTRSGEPLFFLSDSEEGESSVTQSSDSESSESKTDTNDDAMEIDDDSSVYEFDPTDSDREQFYKPEPFPARTKFPYPEAHTQREQPFDIPRASTPPTASSSSSSSGAQPSPSRPQPKPAYRGFSSHASNSVPTPPPPPPPSPPAEPASNSALESIWELTSARWMPEILSRFPHPVAERRRTWTEILNAAGGHRRRCWLKISMIYHPDKNTDMPQEWQDICDAITKGLNIYVV